MCAQAQGAFGGTRSTVRCWRWTHKEVYPRCQNVCKAYPHKYNTIPTHCGLNSSRLSVFFSRYIVMQVTCSYEFIEKQRIESLQSHSTTQLRPTPGKCYHYWASSIACWITRWVGDTSFITLEHTNRICAIIFSTCCDIHVPASYARFDPRIGAVVPLCSIRDHPQNTRRFRQCHMFDRAGVCV